MKNLSTIKLIDLYGKLLTDRQLQMMTEYYCMDLSLSEIATEHGLTRTTVRQHIATGSKALDDFESRLGLSRRLDDLANSHGFDSDVYRFVRAILTGESTNGTI